MARKRVLAAALAVMCGLLVWLGLRTFPSTQEPALDGPAT
jgi:hypothetical protein